MSWRMFCRPLTACMLWFAVVSIAPAADAPLSDAQKLEQSLQATIEFNFHETPLTDVVKFLRDKLAIKTYLDAKALRDANVNDDSPITFQIKGILLRSALRLLLRDLDLKFVPRDGVLWITTKDVADDLTESRVYAVRDLVAQPDDPEDTSRYDFNSLNDCIASTIRPDAWDTSGPAPIERLRDAGALIIRTTGEVHEQITDLLDMLRRVRDQQYTAGKPKPLAERNLAPVLSRGASSPGIRKALAEKMDFDDKPLDEVLQFKVHEQIARLLRSL